jgi:hypothetical protein
MTPSGKSASEGANVSQSDSPRKAYMVAAAAKGEVYFLVYANSIKEIRKNWPDVEREGIENQIHPAGLRAVRRAPEDDR